MLYIMRHGETDWNLENKIQGQSDVPLNDAGRTQAYEMSKKLSRFNPEYIISSDLSRAAETAQIIGDNLNLRVKYDTRLREYNFGILTGLTRAELSPQTVELFFMNPTKFDAEPLCDAFARVGDFLKTYDYNPHSAVVTHGGVINFMLCYLEDDHNIHPHAYLQKCLYTKINNAAILRIKNLESGISILKNKRFFKLQSSK